MDVELEKASAQLDEFIERRAQGRTGWDAANERARLQEESVARHHTKQRQAALWDRLHYHREMLDKHTRTFETLIRRHRVGLRLVEDALGLEPEIHDSEATSKGAA